jgi:hypothetical protein
MLLPKQPILCALFALALIACHREPSQAPQPKPAPKVRAPLASTGPTPAQLTAGMVEAVGQGKSQAPVTLKFDLLQKPTVGQPLEIAIALLPQISAGPAGVAVSAAEGLQVAESDGQIDIPAVEPGQVYRHSIKVTPTQEGVLSITFRVSLRHDEMTDSRVFSVPVIVGSAQAQTETSGARPTGAVARPTGAAGLTSAAGLNGAGSLD